MNLGFGMEQSNSRHRSPRPSTPYKIRGRSQTTRKSERDVTFPKTKDWPRRSRSEVYQFAARVTGRKARVFNCLATGRAKCERSGDGGEAAAQRFCYRFSCMVSPGSPWVCYGNSLTAAAGVVKCDRVPPGEAPFLVPGVTDSCHTETVAPGRKPMYHFDLTVDSFGKRR
jgi:hypothetical protein